MGVLAILKFLIVASVFLSVLALALRARTEDVLYLFREWRLGLRAFVAIFVIVPLAAALLVSAFEFRHEVEVAIMVLSVSPIPPLLPKRQLKSGAEGNYITGLLVAAALVSPIVAPVGLHLFGALLGNDAHVSFANLGTTLAITIVVPLLLGLGLQKLLGEHADRVSDRLGKFAALLLVACGLVLLVMLFPAIVRLVGEGTLVALISLIIVGLLAGYLLGGPSRTHRGALALAAAVRHPGVAMGIAATNFPDEKAVLVTIALYVVLGLLTALPLLMLGRRWQLID